MYANFLKHYFNWERKGNLNIMLLHPAYNITITVICTRRHYGITVYVKAVTVLYLIQIHSPKVKLYTFGFTIHEQKYVPLNAGSKMQ